MKIEFKNPLKISVSVSGASLICQLSVKTDPGESGKELYCFITLHYCFALFSAKTYMSSLLTEAGDQIVNEADRCLSTSGHENDLELEKLKSIWYFCQTL